MMLTIFSLLWLIPAFFVMFLVAGLPIPVFWHPRKGLLIVLFCPFCLAPHTKWTGENR